MFSRVSTRSTCHPDVAALANALAEAVEALQTQPAWSSGDGPPNDALGKDGDLYLDRLTTGIYLKEGGTMGLIGTLQGSQGPAGPTGATGSAGTPGSQWFIEAGPPNDAQGIDNDNWLDTTNGNVYKKVAGTWF